SPDTATPPALAALPGAKWRLDLIIVLTAFSVQGIFAPSAIKIQPFLTSCSTSSVSSSFCVAQGSAISQGNCQGFLPEWNSAEYRFVYAWRSRFRELT